MICRCGGLVFVYETYDLYFIACYGSCRRIYGPFDYEYQLLGCDNVHHGSVRLPD